MVHLDWKDHLACLVTPAHQEGEETKVHQVGMVKMEPMEIQVHLETQATGENLVKMEFLVTQVPWERKVQMEVLVHQVCQVIKDLQENKETL